MEKTDKKIIYYIVFVAATIVLLIVFHIINLRLTPRCASVNSYRGCLVEKGTTEGKFCRTRSKPCKDGQNNCDGAIKRSCVPLYQF